MKFIKENIAWTAPTAAVLFLASNYIDSNRATEEAATPAPAAPPVAVANTAAQGADESTATLIAEIVEQALAPEVTRAAPQPTFVPPAPEPAAEEVAVITQDPAGFFASAQANLATNDRCGDDLRALAADARIYFPSGGLAGSDTGLAQARLLSKVLSECPGFSLRVKGHSDPSGDPTINLRLSQERAEAVIARIAASGIDTSRMLAEGMGSREPSGVRGPEPAAFYDRRVDFEVVEGGVQQAGFTTTQPAWQPAGQTACAERLSPLADQVKVYYAPGSITVPTSELNSVIELAAEVARCEGAILRVVGQHTNAGETITTGRHRALAIMHSLMAQGYPGEQILIGAKSWAEPVPGQPGLPMSRVDFQVIPVSQ